MAPSKDAPNLPIAITTDATSSSEEECYPHGINLAIIIASLAASVFLCALDETIIATAIPRITDEFDSINDIGWYGSAYFMTFASFQLIFGKLFSFYSVKYVFILSVIIFEAGSLICATAPTSSAFIVGRACAGLGSAGINAGFIIILAGSLPLHRRPIFVASYSGTYGVAALTAPLIGGAFTTKAMWRWCFYINLPIGLTAVIAMYFFFHPRSIEQPCALKWREKLGEMDLPGTAFLLPGVVLLLLALQWGGARYPWNSAPVISVLVVCSTALFGFVSIQIYRRDKATVPPRIISQRTVACSSCYVFVAGGAQNIFEYYLPIWFQAIQGITPLESGTRILPFTLGRVLLSFVAGYGVSKVGYYTPFMILGATLLLVGSSLSTTLSPGSPPREWAGFQVAMAMGAGLGIQQAHTGAQTVLSPADVPTGAVVLIFAQIMGGAIWLSLAQNVFTGQLLKGIDGVVPGLDPHDILDMGATGLRGAVPPKYLSSVLGIYNAALRKVFFCAVALAAMALLASTGMEWRSIKKKQTPPESETTECSTCTPTCAPTTNLEGIRGEDTKRNYLLE